LEEEMRQGKDCWTSVRKIHCSLPTHISNNTSEGYTRRPHQMEITGTK